MFSFAAGGRRRGDFAALGLAPLTPAPPIETEAGPPLPSRAIHLGRTQASGADHDEVVYLTGRPVEAPDAWTAAAPTETGSVFRKGDRWGNVSQRTLAPKPVYDYVKQRAALAGFLGLCLALIAWIFKTGWRLKN